MVPAHRTNRIPEHRAPCATGTSPPTAHPRQPRPRLHRRAPPRTRHRSGTYYITGIIRQRLHAGQIEQLITRHRRRRWRRRPDLHRTRAGLQQRVHRPPKRDVLRDFAVYTHRPTGSEGNPRYGRRRSREGYVKLVAGPNTATSSTRSQPSRTSPRRLRRRPQRRPPRPRPAPQDLLHHWRPHGLHLRLWLRRRPRRHLGHNPAGSDNRTTPNAHARSFPVGTDSGW